MHFIAIAKNLCLYLHREQTIKQPHFTVCKQKPGSGTETAIFSRFPLINSFNQYSKIMKKQSVNLKIEPNVKNIPLTEYYNQLPDFRNVKKGTLTPRLRVLTAISDIVGKPVGSIRRWCYGTAKPNLLEKQAIARLLKSDVETLFPIEL